jgi:hypothetical protein
MREDDRLPAELDDVVAHLRQTPVVRQEWRDAAVRQVAVQEIEDPIRRGPWMFTSWMQAIAAALVCMAIGAGGGYAVFAHRTPGLESVPTMASSDPRSSVRFSVVAPGAVSVQLVGDFNKWDPAALPMRRIRNGVAWEIEVPLSPGRYSYAFVIDGKLARDPSAAQAPDDDFGAPSSVLLVGASGT